MFKDGVVIYDGNGFIESVFKIETVTKGISV